MRCVRCRQPILVLGEPCPRCGFQGDAALIEELSHIRWLLDQMSDPSQLEPWLRRAIQQHYLARQRELEMQLGLRLPRFTQEQAPQAWRSLFQYQKLIERLEQWLAAGLLVPSAAQTVVADVRKQAGDLQGRLEGHKRPAYPQTDAELLALTDFLLQGADRLHESNAFVSAEAEQKARAPLLTLKADLETKLVPRAPDLRPTPAQKGSPAPRESATAVPPPPPPKPQTVPAPPPPFRDRLWRTLLSERTLQAMLFLGIFLLFSAALSFVFYGWKDFSAPLRVAIPTAFTLAFFALGWYVREKTRMYRSGIALTAIAALLIPVDFYTVYANFNLPPEYAPSFWLIASLICLLAYLVTTIITQSALFGYLAGAAAGSASLALVEMGHHSFNLSLDWRTAALSVLAVGLALLAAGLNRVRGWRVLSEPFRNLALIAVGAVMLLSFGWRYIDRKTFDLLHYAMTVNWWLGGFLFGWGAIHYRSRTLGILAAIALPVATFMAQAALFDQARINPAWQALGLALLVPIYFVTGNRLLAREDDRVLYGHGRTATGWGIGLTIVAAFWSLTDLKSGAAAASSHAVLAGAMLLAAFLWRRPRILYAASFLSLTATTFAMNELNLSFAQLSIGWASLALGHILAALYVGRRRTETREPFAAALVVGGFIVAALSLLPPLYPYDGQVLAYALGNWLGLSAWSARLSHLGQPGFTPRGRLKKATFHWLTALPLPIWIWILFANQGPLDYKLPLALAPLAWAMVVLSYRLAKLRTVSAVRRVAQLLAVPDLPWYMAGLVTSIAAPAASFILAPSGYAPALCLLASGLLYFTDAVVKRQRFELTPGGLVAAWGWALLLERAGLSFDVINFALAVLAAIYFLTGLWIERRRIVTRRFLAPLYLAGHLLTALVLLRVYVRPFDELVFHVRWTDEMRLWGAASQILFGLVYALYAWAAFQEFWAHAAAWLVAAGGGFVALIYSTGSGSLAARAALGAIAYILMERGLHALRRTLPSFSLPFLRDKREVAAPLLLKETARARSLHRRRAFIRLAWHLYRRPLLVTGWTVSAGTIGLALVRNLYLLGGGRIQQIWAVVGLMLIVGLYALSARLFRQAHFVWFAVWLVFIPWTIMTNLGWLVALQPARPSFAISWVVLAWALFLISLLLNRHAPSSYALPPRVVGHALVPFALLWGAGNVDASRFSFLLAIGYYAFAAILDYRRVKAGALASPFWSSKFLYPALGLIPVWCIYLMSWLLPGARSEHYGLMLLPFGVLGLLAGQWLERLAPDRQGAKEGMENAEDKTLRRAFGLPAYLTGYVAVVFGTLLVAHDPALLSLVLLYDAMLTLVSARLFSRPLWTLTGAVLAAFSFWLAVNQADISVNRQGLWLLGLAAIYLLLTRSLRRARLVAYGTGPLIVAFALIALSLPPSSQDNTGAFWGYIGAAMLYGITAFWLHQPALLIPACALVPVPYAVTLRESALPHEYYGLALFPGAIVALAGGWQLDKRYGAWRDFAWGVPSLWLKGLAERLLNWWALPFYALGLGLATASAFFADGNPGLAALNLALMTPLFGWAIYRFRLRVWLLATAVAGHLAVVFYLQDLGWWHFLDEAGVRFLPVTIVTTFVALAVERRWKEGSPLETLSFKGWSHLLYLIAAYDIFAIQMLSLSGTRSGATVSMTHALLLAVLASFWSFPTLSYLGATLGVVTLLQWLLSQRLPVAQFPVPLAQLALSYGLAGHALAFWRGGRGLVRWLTIWESPLQRFSAWFSLAVLAAAGLLGADLARWTVRALFGLPFRSIVELSTVQMVIGVLSFVGLLYVAAAFTNRRLRLGYVAIGMLLSAWMLYAFYVQQWDDRAQVQWYAVPAGLYLLGIAFLEWQRGNRNLARWLDYAAVTLMMGSLFWQTLLFGFAYALLLSAEGFAAFWWGSARRLRRFLYAGMMGVILATVAQLINSLQSINQWIVFGIIGLLVVIAAIAVERKMEDLKALRQVLETWE